MITSKVQSDQFFDSLTYLHGYENINKKFFSACQQLAESLRSYSDFLTKTMERSQSNRSEVSDTNSIRETLIQIAAVQKVKDEYVQLNELLADKDFYEWVMVNGTFVPEDRKRRYIWFKELKLSSR